MEKLNEEIELSKRIINTILSLKKLADLVSERPMVNLRSKRPEMVADKLKEITHLAKASSVTLNAERMASENLLVHDLNDDLQIEIQFKVKKLYFLLKKLNYVIK